MKLNELLPCSFSLLSVGLASAATVAQSSEKRPNIICILTDDHAYQAISAYGHPISKIAKTPHIDQLAQKGCLFTQSFVENSISTPSRATLLTGLYSHQHGQTRLGCCLDPNVPFISEQLQRSGYHTSVIGKWHLNCEPKGFDYYHLLFDQGEYFNPRFRTPSSQGKFVEEKGYATTLITDHAIEWIEENRKSDAPFFMMLNHKAPHRNWMPDFPYMDLYEEAQFPEPKTLFDDYSTRGSQMQSQELTIKEHMGYAFDLKVQELKDEPTLPYIHDSWDIAMSSLSAAERVAWDSIYARQNASFLASRPTGKELVRWKYQRYIKEYCRTIKSIDDQVGRLITYLEKNNLIDNTFIVYTSDQGFLLGEHGMYDKRFMYEESFRTPLIISYPPLVKKKSVCDRMVQNIDLAPTFLEVAGVEVPETFAGRSLLPLLSGKKVADWRDELYYHFYDYPAVGSVRRHYGIRTDRYKLIHWYGKGYGKDPDIDHWELFDLKKDPLELRNIYNDPAAKMIQRDLHDRLNALRRKIGSTEGD